MLKPNTINFRTKNKKRKGRGLGSGRGKTAGRGTKGQKSRAGGHIPRGFEGGQMPFKQRLPKKRGFKSKREKPVALKISKVAESFKSGEEVGLKSLQIKGLLQGGARRVKIINDGKPFKKKLTFKRILASKSVVKLIEKAGGKLVKHSV